MPTAMHSLHPISSSIASEHDDLINGMEQLYQTFIDLDYVKPTEIQVPPHGLPKEPVAVAQLRSAGLEPETIELIARLPWFTNDVIEVQRKRSPASDGIPIAPFTYAASYLLGPGQHDEAREVVVGPVGGEELLPASAFKLATSNSPNGFNLAYDLNDKTIIKWQHDAWNKCQRIPAAQFLENWLSCLRTLEWLPWQDEHGWQIGAQPAEWRKEEDGPDCSMRKESKTHAEEHNLQPDVSLDRPACDIELHKVARNNYWARRLLYEKCGWPDNFDKEHFEREQQTLE